jgi:uncharacterized protein with von Willebrand factor type A (vWA) domain
MAEIPETPSGRFAFMDDVVGIRIRIPSEVLKAAAGEKKQRVAYICLDKSGSMFESFEIAKKAVHQLMTDLRNQGVDCVLLAYDSVTNCYFEVR